MGKSTGQGSLSLWMWNLITTEIIPSYESLSYSGGAIKLGSGVIAGDAYAIAAEAGYRFVGPECGLVGVAGVSDSGELPFSLFGCFGSRLNVSGVLRHPIAFFTPKYSKILLDWAMLTPLLTGLYSGRRPLTAQF